MLYHIMNSFQGSEDYNLNAQTMSAVMATSAVTTTKTTACTKPLHIQFFIFQTMLLLFFILVLLLVLIDLLVLLVLVLLLPFLVLLLTHH